MGRGGEPRHLGGISGHPLQQSVWAMIGFVLSCFGQHQRVIADIAVGTCTQTSAVHVLIVWADYVKHARAVVGGAIHVVDPRTSSPALAPPLPLLRLSTYLSAHVGQHSGTRQAKVPYVI